MYTQQKPQFAPDFGFFQNDVYIFLGVGIYGIDYQGGKQPNFHFELVDNTLDDTEGMRVIGAILHQKQWIYTQSNGFYTQNNGFYSQSNGFYT